MGYKAAENIEAIFTKYKDNIFGIGFNYFKNSMDADDVVSETFYKLQCYNGDFQSEAHMKNWLIRVAINECKRVTLSSWMKKKVPIDEYIDTLAFQNPEESQLFIAVMELPKKYRQVIHLYYYEGYSAKEISQLFSISESSVSTQLLRGRKKLKEKLLEVWEDE